MSRFTLTALPLEGLVTVDRTPIGDRRGFLCRLFCAEELAAAGWTWPVAQINHTRTETAGTVRGLHFQRPPHAEAKLVTCLRGSVFDVAVDLRAGSPTFLGWHGKTLSADNGRALLIPPGFAHGFQVLGETAELVYCHSALYAPDAEGGLPATDPGLAIDWPLPVAGLSARDAAHPPLTEAFEGLRP